MCQFGRTTSAVHKCICVITQEVRQRRTIHWPGRFDIEIDSNVVYSDRDEAIPTRF